MELIPRDKNGAEIKLGSTIQYQSSRYGTTKARVIELLIKSKTVATAESKQYMYVDWSKVKWESEEIVTLRVNAECNEAYLAVHKGSYYHNKSTYYAPIYNTQNVEKI